MATGVGRLAQRLLFDGVESHGFFEKFAFASRTPGLRALRDAFYTDMHAATTGGSDTHLVDTLGLCYTLLPGPASPEAVRHACKPGRPARCPI